MPRRPMLTSAEKSQILALHQAEHGTHFIASQLERSRHVVSNFLNNPDSYGQRTSPGCPHVISKREERQILGEVSNTTISIGQIRANLNLAASRTTVWRVINASHNIQREATRKAPRLTARHKALRLHFASENIERDWTKVNKIETVEH
ncbi:transposase [Oesophagostomum dentatum]|uniref:Transposase n=1 Tax=Oesophagostomum dentatum TaxID=61180 RepID=A0A0B1TUS6_OESDE|nr:transposase [Oesophagostomum dentatum]